MKTELKMDDGWHYGTGRGAWSAEAFATRQAARTGKKSSRGTQKGVDSMMADVVKFPQSPTSAANNHPASEPAQKGKTMVLTFKGLSRNGRRAIYTGAAQSIFFTIGAFPAKTAPQTIEVADGTFAAAVVRQPKPKLTPEERKAARAAQPKPTLAERIEQRRKALAALEAKLAEAEL